MAPAEPRPRLRRSFSWTLAGNVVYGACQWGILVALTKLGTALMVGQFALALAISTPVFMLTNLNLRTVLATDARRSHSFNQYLALRLRMTLIAYLLVTTIGLISGLSRGGLAVLLAVALAHAFESISDLLFGLLQQNERLDLISRSMMIKSPLALIGFAGTVALTGSVAWGALAWAVVRGVAIPLIDLPAVRRLQSIRPVADRRAMLRLAREALPLGVVMMLMSVDNNLPRYFTEIYLGTEQLGLFAAMAYLTILGTTVVAAMGQAAVPRLAAYYAEGHRGRFRALLGKLLLVAVGLGIAGVLGAALLGRPVLTHVYRPEYAEHTTVLIYLMLAGGLLYLASFLGFALMATRQFKQFMLPYVAVTGVGALACWLLIPRFGMEGAALALVVIALAKCVAPATLLARRLW